jgi:selenocysteine lyase/cysteine desulfurase
MGMLWAREDLFKTLPAFKVRPAAETLPFRWMTGTANFEGIAGTIAAIDYLASLAPEVKDVGLKEQLTHAFKKIQAHEHHLMDRLIDGLNEIPDLRIWGIKETSQFDHRVPTLSITHDKHTTKSMAQALAKLGIFVWSGNHYALHFSEYCELEPHGTLRIGLLHYNTEAEVARLLRTLAAL